MLRTTLTPYPHHSWLADWIAIMPPRVFAVVEYRCVVHRLLLTTSGDAHVAWHGHGREEKFQSTEGDIGFYPRDDAMHRLAITTTAAYRAYVLLLPDEHMQAIHASDGLRPGHEPRPIPAVRDAVIQACLLRLAEGGSCRSVSDDIGAEVAARQIVMRLSVLAGGRSPDWHRDTSVFSPSVMREAIERVDTNLARHPSLEELSTGFGLSPSHFARKFRRSAGLSLNRFMNQRRVGLAMTLLRTTKVTLAQLSLDLGFCSQSHFTRVFRQLTGMTPHQFRGGCRHAGG